MHVDDHALAGLIEESRDLHSDAMGETRASLIGLVARGRERAARSADVQMLQTAASIENLAVATYATALTLPFAKSLPKLVQTFMTTTKDQHTQHTQAFNGALKALGAPEQHDPDPALLAVVNEAKPKLTGAAPLIELAIELETAAAQTYVANVGALTDLDARKVTASIMGVEAQHVAILNAMKALVAANLPELIALPPQTMKLPAVTGSIGVPDPFFKVDQARAAREGAVK
jgi:rubrerythrin